MGEEMVEADTDKLPLCGSYKSLGTKDTCHGLPVVTQNTTPGT